MPAIAVSRRNSTGLARDLDVLEVLGTPEATRAGGLGVSRIAELTGRDKSVISRTLATLADAGILARDPQRLTYRIGPRLYALAARTQEAALVAQARPHLRRIAGRLRETCHLSILQGGSVLTVASELSPREFRTAGWEGWTAAAWQTPSGRVLLSDRDDDELAHWYSLHGQAGLPDAAGATVLDPMAAGSLTVHDLPGLRAEIVRIRATGYTVSDGELELGVVAASGPVTDFTGRIIAALNVSAPKARIPGPLDRLGAFVAHAAVQLSVHLGTPPANLPLDLPN